MIHLDRPGLAAQPSRRDDLRKGNQHEVIKAALNRFFAQQARAGKRSSHMGLDELRSRLEAIQDGLSQVMDLSTRPHDVRIDRSIDYDQHNSMTINQNAQGQAATGTWHRLWKELSTEAADARPI